jgi:hypothetical protein
VLKHTLLFADKLSSGSMSTPDLGISDAGDKLSSAADDAASKAKSVFGSGMSSALPANPLAAVADQNADVRDAATGYRDPAGAVQLDAASGESCVLLQFVLCTCRAVSRASAAPSGYSVSSACTHSFAHVHHVSSTAGNMLSLS